ncbi:hypothetical protein CONPUDRAFT_135377 [Coniophora puteana RWD-64-598 SS2]|uniref:Uncharacterized protein n=1 Tax=Coniophora puteana (strain RWD-64-598) TaxID=741705 RepID=A0A5M3N4S4_CONPW|nr:uncharacterized protein CONPUDRAFT_135377 [Coniophora puteana RWD-64-598 SS2]EIW85845.1 hypothetical protein CONPUDRAFT_135377 [Coniophora puteana RWD-64-598 SS2]
MRSCVNHSDDSRFMILGARCLPQRRSSAHGVHASWEAIVTSSKQTSRSTCIANCTTSVSIIDPLPSAQSDRLRARLQHSSVILSVPLSIIPPCLVGTRARRRQQPWTLINEHHQAPSRTRALLDSRRIRFHAMRLR